MNVIKQQITHEFANLRQRIERKERELDYNIESSGKDFALSMRNHTANIESVKSKLKTNIDQIRQTVHGNPTAMLNYYANTKAKTMELVKNEETGTKQAEAALKSHMTFKGLLSELEFLKSLNAQIRTSEQSVENQFSPR